MFPCLNLLPLPWVLRHRMSRRPWRMIRQSASASKNASAASKLKRLASQRSDVFDANVAQQHQLTEEEEVRRKKQATAVYYDGASDREPARLQQMQNMNIEEQIRQIHQKAKK